MRELSKSELREEQLALLRTFAEYCKINNFRFFLYGGTLLGAVRHAGYIPWDDDIDVAMPRSDYQRFCDLAVGPLPIPGCQLHCPEASPSYVWPFAKLAKDGTVMREPIDVDYAIGINMDVFPLDGWPDGSVSRSSHKTMIWLYRALLTINYISQSSRDRSLTKRCVLRVGKLVVRVVSAPRLVRWFTARASRYPTDTAAMAGVTVWGRQEMVPSAAFVETLDMSFEGVPYPVPAGYDVVLREIYGDYMTPPPPADQVAPHILRAFKI